MSVVSCTVFLLILSMSLDISSAVADFKWCAYKLYMKPEIWAKAKAVCEANGMTLAHITDTAQHAYLTSYVTDQLKKQNPDVQTEAWIGLRKDAGGAVRLDNCNMYAAADYNPIQNLPKDCVYFDAVQPTFMAEDCASSKAFLCQAPALDLNDCFTYKEVSLITQGWNFKKQQLEYQRPAAAECSTVCADNCVAFSYGGGKCTLMTRHFCPCAVNGYYTVKGVLNTDDHAAIPAANIDNFCAGQAVAVSSPEILLTSSEVLASSSEANIQASSSEAIIQASSSEAIIQASSPEANIQASSSEAIIQASSSLVLYPAAMTSEVTSSASSVPYLSIQSVGTTPVINSSPGALPSISTAMLAPTSTSGTSSSHCFCSCGDNKNETMSVEELQQKIRELKSQLSVNKKDLSSWKRKLTSAPDKRTSATGIGFIGVAILLIVGGLVMILDVPTFILEIQRLKEILSKPKDQ